MLCAAAGVPLSHTPAPAATGSDTDAPHTVEFTYYDNGGNLNISIDNIQDSGDAIKSYEMTGYGLASTTCPSGFNPTITQNNGQTTLKCATNDPDGMIVSNQNFSISYGDNNGAPVPANFSAQPLERTIAVTLETRAGFLKTFNVPTARFFVDPKYSFATAVDESRGGSCTATGGGFFYANETVSIDLTPGDSSVCIDHNDQEYFSPATLTFTKLASDETINIASDNTHLLTGSSNPNGTISIRDPADDSVRNTCSASSCPILEVRDGASVKFEAEAAAGYSVDNLVLDGTNQSNPHTRTIAGATGYSAVISEIPATSRLTVHLSGLGACNISDGDQINYGNGETDNTGTYPPGTIQFTVTPALSACELPGGTVLRAPGQFDFTMPDGDASFTVIQDRLFAVTARYRENGTLVIRDQRGEVLDQCGAGTACNETPALVREEEEVRATADPTTEDYEAAGIMVNGTLIESADVTRTVTEPLTFDPSYENSEAFPWILFMGALQSGNPVVREGKEL